MSMQTAAICAEHSKDSNLKKNSRQECKTASDEDAAIKKWFSRYDDIRRESEMSFTEKLQSLLLFAKLPDKRNSELAKRMTERYKTSLKHLKELEVPPETQKLHDGYIEYFSRALKLSDYYEAAERDKMLKPIKELKKELEELDDQNKQLDETLRKKYQIPKHKHR